MYPKLVAGVCSIVIPLLFVPRFVLIKMYSKKSRKNLLLRVQATILKESSHQAQAAKSLEFKPLTRFERWLFKTYIEDKKEKLKQDYLKELVPTS